MTLPRVPTDLTLWLQPWCSTYILKTNLGITFQSYVPGLGYLWQNLSMAIDVTTVIKQVIWRCELSIWPIFQKLWCWHGCQWNLSLSGAFVFDKHILFCFFRILYSHIIYIVKYKRNRYIKRVILAFSVVFNCILSCITFIGFQP
jgi:hypothetical protein